MSPYPAWGAGTDLSTLRGLAEYWAGDYGWRRAERQLNRHPHYQLELDHWRLHFVHHRAEPPGVPVLVVHGWPITSLQMLTFAGALAGSGPQDPGCDVVVPSLPGFPLSPVYPGAPGIGVTSIAAAFHHLMHDVLGYTHYIVRGQDIGVSVAFQMAELFPGHVLGLHVGGYHLEPPAAGEEPSAAGTADRPVRDAAARWYRDEAGYVAIQSTKPETLAFALTDSPVGTLAWIVEKVRAWAGDPSVITEPAFVDDILSLATMYWSTGTAGSAIRIYYEERNQEMPRPEEVPIVVQYGEREEYLPPRTWWRERCPSPEFTTIPGAGHFPEWETPDLLAADVQAFTARAARHPRARWAPSAATIPSCRLWFWASACSAWRSGTRAAGEDAAFVTLAAHRGDRPDRRAAGRRARRCTAAGRRRRRRRRRGTSSAPTTAPTPRGRTTNRTVFLCATQTIPVPGPVRPGGGRVTSPTASPSGRRLVAEPGPGRYRSWPSLRPSGK